jgi:hypothetical protein
MVKVVLSLDDQALDDLFKIYAKEFGPGAAKYAHKTYARWKSGEVRPNRKTFNRLLVHLPRVLSFDLKCEILRKLREEYCSRDSYNLSVNTENWKESLDPLIDSIINKAYTAQLPKQVEERLIWLADQDVQIAHKLIANSQVLASRNTVSLLDQEIYNIEQVLMSTKGSHNITHTIKLPYGTITMKIKRG